MHARGISKNTKAHKATCDLRQTSSRASRRCSRYRIPRVSLVPAASFEQPRWIIILAETPKKTQRACCSSLVVVKASKLAEVLPHGFDDLGDLGFIDDFQCTNTACLFSGSIQPFTKRSLVHGTNVFALQNKEGFRG